MVCGDLKWASSLELHLLRPRIKDRILEHGSLDLGSSLVEERGVRHIDECPRFAQYTMVTRLRLEALEASSRILLVTDPNHSSFMQCQLYQICICPQEFYQSCVEYLRANQHIPHEHPASHGPNHEGNFAVPNSNLAFLQPYIDHSRDRFNQHQ